MIHEKLTPSSKRLFTKLLEQKDGKHLLNIRHYKEGLEKGFTLLSEQPLIKDEKKDYNYKLYICNICGKVDYFQPTHMRRKNCKCSNCFINNISEYAEVVGLELMQWQPDPLPMIFRRKDCGHVVMHSKQAVRNMTERVTEIVTCKGCYEAKINEHLLLKGLEKVSPPKTSKSKAEFLVKRCGHVIRSTYSNLFNNTPQCSECTVDTFRRDVEPHGLKYLGKSKNENTKGHHLYELPCGHIKSMRLDKARTNVWECRECEVTHLDKPSFLYLLHFYTEKFEWLKLGYARNVENRVAGYGVNGTPYTVKYIKEFPTGQQVKDFEIQLHKSLKHCRISKTTMKNFHKNNGGNECYPVSETESIIELIQERIKD
jgi:hypothetical protein